MPIGVLVADDHPIFRQGLRALLTGGGFSLVAECANGYEALESAKKLRPDIAVLDISMPGLNGIDAAREMAQISPRTKTILLTIHAEDQYIREGLRSGIKAYVHKTEAGTSLVQAIHEVSRGNMYVSPAISKPIADACSTGSDAMADPLTPREVQVLQLIASGHTTAEVAKELKLSVKTAESYRTRLMEKLDIHETASLVRYAIRRGLISA